MASPCEIIDELCQIAEAVGRTFKLRNEELRVHALQPRRLQMVSYGNERGVASARRALYIRHRVALGVRGTPLGQMLSGAPISERNFGLRFQGASGPSRRPKKHG